MVGSILRESYKGLRQMSCDRRLFDFHDWQQQTHGMSMGTGIGCQALSGVGLKMYITRTQHIESTGSTLDQLGTEPVKKHVADFLWHSTRRVSE